MSAVKSHACTCGAVLSVKPEHAGKTLACPRCKRSITIPGQRAATSSGVIPFTCQCGKTLKAHAGLVGKRAKCPGCGKEFTVPAPHLLAIEAEVLPDEQVETNAVGQHDRSGQAAADVVTHSTVRLSPVAIFATAAASGVANVRRGVTAASRGKTMLRDCAGWIALCYGGYQAVTTGYGLAYFLVLRAQSGSLANLVHYTTIAGVISLVLGVCLAIPGLQIVRREEPRQALERAAYVSIAYLVIFVLGVVLSAPSLLRLTAQSPGDGLIAFVRLASNAIYFAPPAFIIFVHYLRKK